MAAVFDVTDFLHPQDLSARQQLEAIPLLQQTVKKYLAWVSDRRYQQALLASAVRLRPNQLPAIYRMLPPICDAFGIPEPELYLMRGSANAFTIGHSRVAIVINHEILEDLAEDEIQAVLAHECGHILAEHTLYRQMAQAMVEVGESAAMLGSAWVRAAAGLASMQIRTALLNWYRKSELTADRAAVAFFRDPEPMQRALFHIIGAPKWMPAEISYADIVEQADEFDRNAASSKLSRHFARELETGSTHPNPALRIRELAIWASSPTFKQLFEIAQSRHLGQSIRCASCGQEISPEWRFCKRCGTPVSQASASVTGDQP
jgi:Zn-dependent protease with chaperone function